MAEDNPPLGRLLRERRAYHGWTLAEVSAMTGISTATLSKIENGLLSPTYEKILQLSRGLNVEIADLLGPQPVTDQPERILARRSVSLQFAGGALETEFYTYTYLCSDVAHKRIVPIHIEVRASTEAQMGELTSHVGEEFVVVLEGAVRIFSEYYEPIDLAKNDSLYLDSTMKHGYMSLDPKGSRLLVNCSSATPNLAQTLREVIKSKIVEESRQPRAALPAVARRERKG
ncbi:helix-turn-helix domain-containing protein [Labrys wisconsinensis]|uniref:Transcriptional regulator with XRE-family HTH domain n=1 Tax=Labrys wisconsinensis TaxID=425677 RepID=A0ABU0JHJ1_9HYPH|nr:XRE family transcriptional regulator [Labrys wisconsinensis]MDQ0472888.1 transcriptional regulator with XRE-family HTH domain [Labrys wisconsinensis]